MKLSNLGVKFIVDDEQVQSPSCIRPTKLYFSGRPSYVLIPAEWGFILEPENDMLTHVLSSSNNATFRRRDLLPIVVDRQGFKSLSAAAKMRAIRDALLARISTEQATLAKGAIDWWLDQILENDNQSP